MDVAVIGMGRMGAGVASRLLKAGHNVVVYNRTLAKTDSLKEQGAEVAATLKEVVEKLSAPRVVWLYLPSGEVTQEAVAEFANLLEPGDVLIDGGNSNFHHTLDAAKLMEEKSIGFIDVGTSGGVAGKEVGYCLMMGGPANEIERLSPLWEAIAQPGGFVRVGPAASGHYVKMIHNAIEYGMMQAYGEGMELLANSQFSAELDLEAITGVWQQGSIIRSYLGQLLHEAMKEAPTLEGIGARIEDNGEGRWAIEEGISQNLSTPVITAALYARYESRNQQHFSNKVVSVLRNKFGGHSMEKVNSPE